MSKRPDARRYQRHKPQLLRLYRGRCSYCLRRLRCRRGVIATVDHIIAYRDGGPPDIANLRPACMACNLVRDALMSQGIADPQGPDIVRIYARALLLLGNVSQSRGQLAAAGMPWQMVQPALDWLVSRELAVYGELAVCGELTVCGQVRWPGWRATRTGLKLARAVRTGVRGPDWLREVLGDPRLVHHARRGPRRLTPALLARYVDGGGAAGTAEIRTPRALARAA